MSRVCIDPGHGGRDPGASFGDLREKDITLKVARMTRDYLISNYNVEVRLTRDSDKFVPLGEISNISNTFNADLFVSIHANAGGGTGYEDYTFSGLGATSPTHDRRNIFHSEVAKVLDKYKLRNRGKKSANFSVLRNTRASAILTELAFIDTARDRELLQNDEFLTDMAIAHAMGIVRALNLKANSKPLEPVVEPVEVKPNGGDKLNDWQKDLGEKAIDDLLSKGLLNNPEDWKSKLGDNVPNWLFFTMLSRILK